MTGPSRSVLWLTGLALLLTACNADLAVEKPETVASPVTTVMIVPACAPEETDGDLYTYNWDDYIDPALIAGFEQKFGVEVVEDFYSSNDALFAKLQSGAIYDLVVPSDYMAARLIEEGYLAELQRDAIPNLSNLDAFFADPAYDPGGAYSAAYQWWTSGLVVNRRLVGDFTPSWALVFDEETLSHDPGGVTLLAEPRETLGAALKYLGYSLNSTEEEQLAEAAEVISSVKDHVVAFDSEEYLDKLTHGEVSVSQGSWVDFLAEFGEEPGNFEYVVPREGASVHVDAMAIPVNADHPCTAHAFINFILDAENGAVLTEWNRRASPNQAAADFVDPEILEDEALYPPDEVMARLEMIGDIGAFESRYTEYFMRVQS